MGESDRFRVCSTCRKEIGFQSTYYVCSVSTCNRRRTGVLFCSMACWDAHLPEARHREAWAEERRAPTRDEWARELAEDGAPEQPAPRLADALSDRVRRICDDAARNAARDGRKTVLPRDVPRGDD